MARESERVFLQLIKGVPFSVKGMLIASQARQENFGIARNALGDVVTNIQNIAVLDEQRAVVVVYSAFP